MQEHYSTAIESCNPSDLFANDIMAICSRELAALPQETREVYLNSRIKGMSYKEIAELMGISPRKVERHILKALAALRVSLADFLDFIVIIIALQFFIS